MSEGITMPHLGRFLSVAAAALLLLFPISAYAEDWLVTRTTKQVSYTVDKKNWVPVLGGMSIPNKAWISTGPRGRLSLERGVEKVMFGPQTLAAIITEDGLFSRKTNVVQQKGELALDIEKRNRPHTYVHTPFLAAVVKGTSFRVTVTAKDASVAVERGLVQVSSFTGGQSTNLGPGQQATVNQSQSMSVAGVGGPPSIQSAAPSRASIAPVGQVAPIGADVTSETGAGNSVSSVDSSSDPFGSSDSGGYGHEGSVGGPFGSSNNGHGPGSNNGNGPGSNNGNGPGSNNGNGPGSNNGKAGGDDDDD